MSLYQTPPNKQQTNTAASVSSVKGYTVFAVVPPPHTRSPLVLSYQRPSLVNFTFLLFLKFIIFHFPSFLLPSQWSQPQWPILQSLKSILDTTINDYFKMQILSLKTFHLLSINWKSQVCFMVYKALHDWPPTYFSYYRHSIIIIFSHSLNTIDVPKFGS